MAGNYSEYFRDKYYPVKCGHEGAIAELAHGVLRRGPDCDIKAEVGDCLMIDTTDKAVMVGLPDNPKPGDMISWIDVALDFSRNNLIIHRNGHRIMGVEDNLCCDKNGDNGALIYTGPHYGWRIADAVF